MSKKCEVRLYSFFFQDLAPSYFSISQPYLIVISLSTDLVTIAAGSSSNSFHNTTKGGNEEKVAVVAEMMRPKRKPHRENGGHEHDLLDILDIFTSNPEDEAFVANSQMVVDVSTHSRFVISTLYPLILSGIFDANRRLNNET